jgi:hypothetical protein
MGTEEYLLQKAKKEGYDAGFKIGFEIGIEKSIEKGFNESAGEKTIAFVKSLLANTDFDDEKVAAIASVTIDFVKKIKSSSN